MKELNLSISTNEKAVKQRVVTFNCTISGNFKMTVICIKFVDRTFTQYQERPLILQLEDRLYIALYQYGMSDKVVNKYIYSEVTIPSTFQNREILLTTHSPAERYQMIAIAQDGANGQIQAMQQRVVLFVQILSSVNVLIGRISQRTILNGCLINSHDYMITSKETPTSKKRYLVSSQKGMVSIIHQN